MSEKEVKVDKALDNRFYAKFEQIEIGLLSNLLRRNY